MIRQYASVAAPLCFFIATALMVDGNNVYAGLTASTTRHSSPCALLANARLSATIDTCSGSPTFGMVMSLYDKHCNVSVGRNQLFRLHSGRTVAFSTTTQYCTSDTIILKFGEFGLTKMSALMEYALLDECITLQMKLFSDEPTDYPEGIGLDFQTDFRRISCSNHLSKIMSWNVDTLKGAQFDFNQIVQFSDSCDCMTFVMRNPFHSHFGINTNGKNNHTLFILQCAPPGTQTGTAAAFSTIGANDTIIRRIEVYPSNRISAPVFFCEHPNGFSNTVTMFWDELPNRDNWAFMTTDTAMDTKYYRFFVRLLHENPDVKMGFVLLPDRLVNIPSTTFQNWTLNSPYIIADTMEKCKGSASMLMLSDSIRSLTACQKVFCRPNSAYTLTYKVKTSGIIGIGAYGEVYADTHLINYGTHELGDNSWGIKGFDFKTSARDSVLSVFLRLQNSKGIVFFDDVRLTPFNGDTNLLLNGGFESFVPGFLYENPRRHWVDAHGPERIVTAAPNAYLQFLQRIENHSLRYGWEDRVEIGCHGYHHTSSLFEPDPKHEFDYYDPFGDNLRMEHIFSEYRQMGLTKASLRFWRSPGFAYSKSLLDLLVDSGFVFFDAPNLGGPAFTAYMLQRAANRMWLAQNTWWADYDSVGNSTNRLFSVLAQGHLAVIGGHPELVFNKQSDASFQRFHGILSAMKDACPSLGYVFPDEYADNADALYQVRIESIRREGKNIVLRFRGKIRAGNTLVYLGKCDKVTLNNAAIRSLKNNDVTYAVLPGDYSGTGTVVFENGVDNQSENLSQPTSCGNHAAIGKEIAITGGGVAVYTLSGQRVCFIENTAQREIMGKLRYGNHNLGCGVFILMPVRPSSAKMRNVLLMIPR